MHLERFQHFRAPPARLRSLLADTDGLNREVGLPPVTCSFVPLRYGRAALKGIDRKMTLHHPKVATPAGGPATR